MRPIFHRVGVALRAMVAPGRLYLALKTAVAATAAWLVGTTLPGELGSFAYYASFGAMVAMAPTVVSSLGSSIKALIGVVLGLLTAWGLVLLGVSGVIALPIAVAVATVLAGFPGIGPGRDYIPLAAVFAFLVGGENMEDFSVGFALQFAIGACLGAVINVIAPPPLGTKKARAAVDRLADEIAGSVETFADSLDGGDEESSASWTNRLAALDIQLDEARDAFERARQSRPGNVRARSPRHRIDDIERTLDGMAHIVRQLHEFTAPFLDEADAVLDEERASPIPGEIREGVSRAGRRVATLIRDPGAEREERDDEARDAIRAIHDVEGRICRWQTSALREQQRVHVLTYALRRIIAETWQSPSDDADPSDGSDGEDRQRGASDTGTARTAHPQGR